MKLLLIIFPLFISMADPYVSETRHDYILTMLESFSKGSYKDFVKAKNWVSAVASISCRSQLVSLKLECFLSMADNYCKENHRGVHVGFCKNYVDILIVNQMNQHVFISKKEKYFIVKNYKNWKRALENELLRRYGKVAMTFSLSPEFECGLDRPICFAESLDRFCLRFSDQGRLTWQACVAALIRFTSRPTI